VTLSAANVIELLAGRTLKIRLRMLDGTAQLVELVAADIAQKRKSWDAKRTAIENLKALGVEVSRGA
jgi:hypothetical protein